MTISPTADIVTPERLREVLLNLSVDASAFVPARALAPEPSETFRRALALSQGYARRALAQGTLENYARHWRAYLTWCAVAGEDPVGPDAPEVVAAHLSWLATGEVDDVGDLVTDEDGASVRPPLTSASVDLRLASINKAFELLGLTPPGSHPYVRKVKAGIHRVLGTFPERRKAALDLPRLRTVLEATYEPTYEALRDVVALRLHVTHRLTAGQLARLEWGQVDLGEVLAIEPPRRTRAASSSLLVPMSAPGDRGGLTWALRRLHEFGAVGPVLAHARAGLPTPEPLSDRGITKIIQRAEGDDLEEDVARLLAPKLIDVRDRALLLNGFAGALRRSNLIAFEWRDFTVHGDKGLSILLRRSKTDQEGKGFEVWIPNGSHELTCPVRAWQRWRWAVASHLGSDPMEAVPRQPVFVGVDRHGRLNLDSAGGLVQLRDDSFNDVVKERARQAGLVGDFGAHSLRAGFVTTAVDADVPLHEVAEQTGHKSIEALRVYIRRVNGWNRNPLARMGI